MDFYKLEINNLYYLNSDIIYYYSIFSNIDCLESFMNLSIYNKTHFLVLQERYIEHSSYNLVYKILFLKDNKTGYISPEKINYSGAENYFLKIG